MPEILTEGDALLADILANPDDDGLRFIYADYLDEHGQPERAEFIRVQCELARGGFSCDMWMYSCGELLDTFEKLAEGGCKNCKRRAKLVLREHELLPRMASAWRFTDVAPTFHRGFAVSVECEQEAWVVRGPAVIQAHPVKRVRVSDREPWTADGRTFYWYGGDVLAQEYITPAIYFWLSGPVVSVPSGSALRMYPGGRDAAKVDLSNACFLYARQESPE